MKLYKITDRDGTTQNNTQWGEGVTHKAANLKRDPKLCTNTVIHAYRDPVLAAVIYLVHVNYNNPLLWEAEGEIVVEDSLKVGCRELTTIKQIPLPEISLNAKTRFAILCALEVYKDDNYVQWANKWLNGADRTANAAAYTAANAAAYTAAYVSDLANKSIDFVALIHKAIADEAEYERKGKV